MASDTSGPKLTSAVLPVRTLTPTSSAISLLDLGLKIGATDDQSGLNYFTFYWLKPSGGGGIYVGSSGGSAPLSGSALNGTWLGNYSEGLNQYSESGTYEFSRVRLTDKAGNYTDYGPQDLLALGIKPTDLSFAIASPPTYFLTTINSSVNEGSVATFTLTTTNVASGTSVPYTLSGISASDVSGGFLSGNAVVNSSGVATISVTLLNDSLTEGSETLTVTAGGATASTVVNDTSVAAIAQYQLNATSTSVDEGGFTQFILYTKNVAIGTTINYTLAGTGITSADIVGGSLSGTAVVASTSFNGFTGGATININIAADNFTEGAESLEIYSQGQSANIRIRDTSTTLIPTYSLQTLTGGSVNEGTTATFILTTTNVASGTSVPYTLSGISAADVSSGSLSGNAVVNSSGVATISVVVLNDSLTEGSVVVK
jgi:hypothetical protein